MTAGGDDESPTDDGRPLEGELAASPAHASIDNPDDLLDPRKDPGAGALGSLGAEASVDLPWHVLLRRRVGDRAAKSPRYQWWVLGALMAGLLALNFTFTVFNVVLVQVAHQFHTTRGVLTWTLTGPLLAFGLAAPLSGRLGDLFGHRRLYLFGLAGAMVSAVLTALSTGVGMLLFARILDGVQGAATGTASAALINVVFAREDRVKALGWWTLIGAGGPVIGISIGSPIIQAFGWRALFWFQLVLLVLAFTVVALILPATHGRHGSAGARHAHELAEPEPTSPRRANIDWLGTWSLTIGVLCAMLALTNLQTGSLQSPWVWGMALGALLAGTVFAVDIIWAKSPLIPKRYFTRRNFMFPMGVRAFGNFAYFGGFILLPPLLQFGYGYSVGQVGFISIARPLVFALSSPIAGYFAVKVGERTSAVFGAAALVASMLVFTFFNPHTSLVVIIIALALSGLGMGVAMPSAGSTMANEVAESEYGVMSAAGLLATQLGEVAGIQILTTIQVRLAQSSGAHPSDRAAWIMTFHLPYLIGGIVGLLGVGCALFIRSLDRSGSRPSGAVDLSH